MVLPDIVPPAIVPLDEPVAPALVPGVVVSDVLPDDAVPLEAGLPVSDDAVPLEAVPLAPVPLVPGVAVSEVLPDDAVPLEAGLLDEALPLAVSDDAVPLADGLLGEAVPLAVSDDAVPLAGGLLDDAVPLAVWSLLVLPDIVPLAVLPDIVLLVPACAWASGALSPVVVPGLFSVVAAVPDAVGVAASARAVESSTRPASACRFLFELAHASANAAASPSVQAFMVM